MKALKVLWWIAKLYLLFALFVYGIFGYGLYVKSVDELLDEYEKKHGVKVEGRINTLKILISDDYNVTKRMLEKIFGQW